MQGSDVVTAGEREGGRGRERERERGAVCLNPKLFVDERKRAPEEGGNMYKPQQTKNSEREHTCSSALSPREGRKEHQQTRCFLSVCVCASAWRVCVCVGRCAQVFSELVLPECTCLFSLVNLCHISVLRGGSALCVRCSAVCVSVCFIVPGR